MLGSRSLARSERVRRRQEFERAYNEGARIFGRFMTVFVCPTPHPGMRLGVAASRKVGRAVYRNRAKRLARELFRRNKIRPFETQPGLDVIVVPRREMLDAPFSILEADYLAAIEKSGSSGRSRKPGSTRRRAGPAQVL